MKRHVFAAFVLLAVGAASSSAFAQSGRPFDGLYAGGKVGWETIDLGVDQVPTTSMEENGVTYAFIAGYRRQFATGWVGGLEAGLGRSTSDGILEATLDGTPRRFAIDSDWQYGMDALIGYTVTAEALLFARIGYRLMDLDVRPETAAGTAFAEAARGTTDGYRLGGGVEFRFTDEINLRVGGAYTSYGSDTVDSKTYGLQAGAVYHY